MAFKLEFSTTNAAFVEGTDEIQRILKDVASRLYWDGKKEGVIRDINGNTIGHFELTEDE